MLLVCFVGLLVGLAIRAFVWHVLMSDFDRLLYRAKHGG